MLYESLFNHAMSLLFVVSSERDTLRARLTNLEDEGVAVKESLVQLLQEKSATNRTLTLENQRLRTKVLYHIHYGCFFFTFSA